MTEIVQFPGQPQPSREEAVRADVIAKLELFLGMAKAGHIVGLSLGAVLADGCVATGMVVGDNAFALIGVNEAVKMRLLNRVEL